MEHIWATASINALNVHTMKPSNTVFIFFIYICKVKEFVLGYATLRSFMDIRTITAIFILDVKTTDQEK